LTEQGPEYLEAIVEASRNLNVSIEDLTQEQFMGYIDQNATERRKALTLVQPDEIQELDWEKAIELAIIIDSASKQIAEKYRFNIDTSLTEPSEQNWKFGQLIAVKSRRGIIELSLLTTLIFVILSVTVLFVIALLSKSIAFGEGIIPTIAIPLIIGPIVSYIIFTQSYHLTQAITQIDNLSRTDPLTGLYNKRFFTELVAMEMAVASRYEISSSILLIDLDHFKMVNDTHGHLAGDEVIRIISSVIRRNVRRTDVVARFGGEEFVVFLPHTNLEGALTAANRVRRIIAESEITFKTEQIGITASIGVASTGIEINNIELLLQAAGLAVDAAKEKGSDLVECLPQISQESAIASEVIEVQST
jgi:diguanylate cyclase (GGDEF)-like protein